MTSLAFITTRLTRAWHTPLFRVAGMLYLDAIDDSDLDYLYNNMFSRDRMSGSDRHVSDTLITSFVSLAFTGRPDGEGLPSWPQSFTVPSDLNESQVESDEHRPPNIDLS